MVNAKNWMVQLLAVCMLVVAPLAPAQAGIIGTAEAIAMNERAEAVAALTDAELAQLEGRLEALPAGGDTLAVLGVVLLVLVILDIAGVTNVFTFV